jgi:hypothetical protein
LPLGWQVPRGRVGIEWMKIIPGIRTRGAVIVDVTGTRSPFYLEMVLDLSPG